MVDWWLRRLTFSAKKNLFSSTVKLVVILDRDGYVQSICKNIGMLQTCLKPQEPEYGQASIMDI